MSSRRSINVPVWMTTILLISGFASTAGAMTGDSLNVSQLGAWAHGPCNVIEVQGTHIYFGDGSYLRIADTGDPALPVDVGSLLLPEEILDIAVVGDYAYVANDESGLRIVNVSDPAHPVEVGHLDIDDSARDVYVGGEYAYVTGHMDGILIVDVSDPAHPAEAGHLYTSGNGSDIYVVDHYAYVILSGHFTVFDMSDPAAPVQIGAIGTSFSTSLRLLVSGDYAYLCTGNNICIIDVTDPSAPFIVDGNRIPTSSTKIDVAGQYAYLAYDTVLRIYDISDPADPVFENSCELAEQIAFLTVDGNQAYVADQYQGLRIVDITPATTPHQVGYIDTGSWIYDVTTRDGLAFVSDFYYGLRIFDVSDSSAPNEISTLASSNGLPGVAVSGDYAYIQGDDTDLIRIIDVSDPYNPVEVNAYGAPLGARHIFIVDRYIYVATSGSGIRILDMSDPVNPIEVGNFDSGSSAWGLYVSGNFAYVAYNYSGLRAYDVSDPTAPVLACDFDDHFGAEFEHVGVHIEGDFAYVVGDKSSTATRGLHIFDVSDPYHPVEEGAFMPGGFVARVFVSGNYAYMGNNVDGFRVVDVSNPSAPVEAGYYDTGGQVHGITVVDDTIYVADLWCGLHLFNNDLCTGLSGTMSLNNGAVIGDTSISINSNVTGAVEMRFSLDGENWPEGWVPYNVVHVWEMAMYNGTQTVYGQYRDDCVLTLTDDIVVPAMLTRFNVEQLGDAVSIAWETATNPEPAAFRLSADDQGAERRIGFSRSAAGRFTALDEAAVASAGHDVIYRLHHRFDTGVWKELASEKVFVEMPQRAYGIIEVVPNPFNPKSSITYMLNESGNIRLGVYALSGRLIKTLVDTRMGAGLKTVEWDGTDAGGKRVASGTYFLRLETNQGVRTRKVMLAK
jgi:hypothetical protein